MVSIQLLELKIKDTYRDLYSLGDGYTNWNYVWFDLKNNHIDVWPKELGDQTIFYLSNLKSKYS